MIDRIRAVTRTIRYAVERRPVRVAEAALALAAALGLALLPEVEDAVLGLLTTLVAVGVIGGELAQTQTTSKRHPALDHEVEHELADVPDHLEPLPDTEG